MQSTSHWSANNKTAKFVQAIFLERGSRSNEYQILVTDHADDNWTEQHDGNFFAKIINLRNLNIWIYRLNIDDSDRAREAFSRFKNNRPAMMTSISSWQHEQPDELLALLSERFGSLAHSQLYSGVVLIKKHSFFSMNAQIYCGVPSMTYIGGYASNWLHYENNHFMTMATTVKLFVF